MDSKENTLSSNFMRENDVISFYDSLLHKEDVDLLTGPYWLNDSLIAFYFEYLEKVAFSDQERLLFISPQVTQCVKMSRWEDVFVFLDPLNFSERDFVFLPVNDCDTIEIPGGTHWSLLVFSKPENLFCHIDSSSGSNQSHAWRLGTNLSRYMKKEVDYTEIGCLQQRNSYDCGIHVLCTVDQIGDYSIKENKIVGAGWLRWHVIDKKRKHLLELISSIKQAM